MIFLIILLGLLCSFVPLGILLDGHFRRQIMELRADRIGLEVSRVKTENACAALSYLEPTERGEKSNPFLGYYKRYIAVETHPSLERRIKELKRGKRWGVMEYIRYLCLIKIRERIGLGKRL